MTTILSSEIQYFAALMQEKLDENAHKGGWKGWHEHPSGAVRARSSWRESNDYLLSRLGEEVEELKQAIAEGKSAVDVAREAADVANFAMMIADVARDPSPSSQQRKDDA